MGRRVVIRWVCLALTAALVTTATRTPAHCDEPGDVSTPSTGSNPGSALSSIWVFRPITAAAARPIPLRTPLAERWNVLPVDCLIFALPPPFAFEIRGLCSEGEEKVREDVLGESILPIGQPIFNPPRAAASAVKHALSLVHSGSIQAAFPLRC